MTRTPRFAEIFAAEKPVVAMAHPESRRPSGVARSRRSPHADGVIVGGNLEVEGSTWSPVDPARVTRFLAAARS